jgi:peptidoglycan/LPS O-acetylase OafA/YrhL
LIVRQRIKLTDKVIDKNIKAGRYRTIDGMRGLAALSVVFYHLSKSLSPELNELLPHFVNILFSFGYLGVPVFFVISGFVISLSIGSNIISRQYFGNFILRRSIRLDPTYWVSILIAIFLLFIKSQFLSTDFELPSFSMVLSHMFYLQDILEVSPVISVIYWTLCLEVQFYLFFIISVWLSQRLSQENINRGQNIHYFIILTVGVFSLAVDFKLIILSVPGLFISTWHYFLMGVLVSNAVRQQSNSLIFFISWLIIELIFQINYEFKAYALGGMVSGSFIYVCWKFNLLDSVLTSKQFQFLGLISYTLYLIHPDIGWKFISVGKHLFDNNVTPLISGLLFISGIIVSIIFAYGLHLLIEKPTLKLCNKLKKQR